MSLSTDSDDNTISSSSSSSSGGGSSHHGRVAHTPMHVTLESPDQRACLRRVGTNVEQPHASLWGIRRTHPSQLRRWLRGRAGFRAATRWKEVAIELWCRGFGIIGKGTGMANDELQVTDANVRIAKTCDDRTRTCGRLVYHKYCKWIG